MKNIVDIAKKLDLNKEDLYCYGDYMAKICTNVEKDKKAKLILVTAINPTPYGEGKTTVSIGLNDALCKLGKKSVVVLREPSLGPVFGMKGGACGGGCATIIPEDDINMHFTGDFHAITAANNLLASAIDNHIYQGNLFNIDEDSICFKRCLDINDRSLRGKFNITAASEVMAIFSLAKDIEDLRNRLANILCCYTKEGKPIYAKDLKVDGAMFKLLKQAFYPNLVQTSEENPAIVHGGPFANIAHGCSSITSLNLATNIADYVVTEAGFGSDLGFEKFMNIVSREDNIIPSYAILVVTTRALEHNTFDNLLLHIENLKQYNVPFCVAINKFSEDNEFDLNKIFNYCHELDISCIVTNSYQEGSNGSIELANHILNNIKDYEVKYLYSKDISIKEKITTIINKTYKILNVTYTNQALTQLERIDKLNLNHFPVCIAKTQYAYSKDIKEVNVRDIKIETGSRMIIVLLDKIITMPGLPKTPNYEMME